VAQGAIGTWRVVAGLTVGDTAGSASVYAKLWDGTTVIASGSGNTAGPNGWVTIFLEGKITAPAANLKASAQDNTSTSGKIKASATGAGKDSYIQAIRIA
jgi:hypothetical protein